MHVLAPCSKPTVWDGDKVQLCDGCGKDSVLSPPCGMETRNSASTRRAFSLVLSPPCGMETCPFRYLFRMLMSSKPTVWDGDLKFDLLAKGQGIGSKPTVWDGDKTFSSQQKYSSMAF